MRRTLVGIHWRSPRAIWGCDLPTFLKVWVSLFVQIRIEIVRVGRNCFGDSTVQKDSNSSPTFRNDENCLCILYDCYCYRAMHFSARRGIAIACRLSVRPSVTLVDCDHIGWNSSKIISPLVSPGCSLFATPTWRVCSKGNAPKFGPKVTHPLLT